MTHGQFAPEITPLPRRPVTPSKLREKTSLCLRRRMLFSQVRSLGNAKVEGTLPAQEAISIGKEALLPLLFFISRQATRSRFDPLD
jgi:hypothetical protein